MLWNLVGESHRQVAEVFIKVTPGKLIWAADLLKRNSEHWALSAEEGSVDTVLVALFLHFKLRNLFTASSNSLNDLSPRLSIFGVTLLTLHSVLPHPFLCVCYGQLTSCSGLAHFLAVSFSSNCYDCTVICCVQMSDSWSDILTQSRTCGSCVWVCGLYFARTYRWFDTGLLLANTHTHTHTNRPH